MKTKTASTYLRHEKSGFTIVEMLVVIGIVGVLASLLLPTLSKARGRSRAMACQGNLRTLGQGMQVAMEQEQGALPKVYYSFQGTNGNYIVSLKSPTNDTPDTFFQPGYAGSLSCPGDKQPVPVLAYLDNGYATTIPTGYAYNVSLPALFRNISRVRTPVNTIVFFDGDASAAVGSWSYSSTWGQRAISFRHAGGANCLYLDGHVATVDKYPEEGFQGGDRWVASAMNAGETSDCCPTGTLPPPYIPPVPTTLPPPVTTTTLPSVTTTTLHATTTTTITTTTTTSTTTTSLPGLAGTVNLSTNKSDANSFQMTVVNGIQITDTHLKNDTVIVGPGFNANYLEYAGVATYIRFRPKTSNTLMVNGVSKSLRTNTTYTITATAMTVQLYNDSRNKQGKANGKWMLTISGTNATISPVP